MARSIDDPRLAREPSATGAPPIRYEEERAVEERKPLPRYSVGATFLGWCVATFLTTVFVALAGLALGGAALFGDGQAAADAQELGVLGALALLVAVFLGYLVGGYAAGRIALWNGMSHGAVVPVWAILFAIVAAITGLGLAGGFTAPLPAAFDPAEATGAILLGIVLTLVAMFGGAILGGMLGQRFDVRDREAMARAVAGRRGRPY